VSTFAIVAVWKMDPELADAQLRGLKERIIPMSRLQPGFVQGRWTRASDGVRHIAFVEFDSAEHADAFAAMVHSPEQADRRQEAGVTNESFDILEVIGAA
jgi:hypothetical protein